ncbi:hypothetical protein ACIBSV_14930 [Embleya sp. NPDC050154]|uniref:hypothetical protein n=1 Tax=Embleya sp. NPDC050154 TaxID=3363988 RepID=UPI0037BCEEE3
MNEIGTIAYELKKLFRSKLTQGPVGASPAKETDGEAPTPAPDPLRYMPKEQRRRAARDNQQRFPPNSVARPGVGKDTKKREPKDLEKPGPPARAVSDSEATKAFGESLRADVAAFRDKELLGKKPAPRAKAPDVDKSLAKSAATGFVPAAGGGASGRSSAAVEVNRHEPSRTLGVSRVGAGAELKQNLEK